MPEKKSYDDELGLFSLDKVSCSLNLTPSRTSEYLYHTIEMLAWTTPHCAPFGCWQHSQNHWKLCFQNRNLVISATSRTSSTSISTRHSSSLRQLVVRHAFVYKMQLVRAVKEGQFHNLTEHVQAEQQQHFAHFLTHTSNKATPNTINCSGEKPLVLASN